MRSRLNSWREYSLLASALTEVMVAEDIALMLVRGTATTDPGGMKGVGNKQGRPSRTLSQRYRIYKGILMDEIVPKEYDYCELYSIDLDHHI